MRRKLAIVLVIGMMFMMVGCTKTDDTKNNSSNSDTTTQEDSQATEKEQGSTVDGTVGEILKADFIQRMKDDPSTSPEDLAAGILSNSVIEFKGMTQEVQEGVLTGFTDEVSGFEKAVQFIPAKNAIAFVGYIFVVPEGQDVGAFVEALKTNANPRWNVCTEADETVVEASGNTVFFLMCPKSFEE